MAPRQQEQSRKQGEEAYLCVYCSRVKLRASWRAIEKLVFKHDDCSDTPVIEREQSAFSRMRAILKSSRSLLLF